MEEAHLHESPYENSVISAGWPIHLWTIKWEK